MKFEPTPLDGAWVIELEPRVDDRGYFARSFCRRELEAHGIDPTVVQCNTSFNSREGTLRGMHYQTPPALENKLVRCVRGALYDVIVDLRPESPTYLEHFGVELSADNHKALFVPGHFAHGYLTLEPGTEALYMVSEYYTPDCEDGLRFDDPELGIEWPTEVKVVSSKDAAWPLWRDRKKNA